MAQETTKAKAVANRYRREFGGSMLLYTAVILLATAWLRAHPASPWRVPVALLPLIPVLLSALAVFRFFTDMDELQRRMLVETLAFAFAGSALVVVTYGFLEAAGFPRLSIWWVWVAMGTWWCLGSVLTARRYR